jgi:hypothetical protein
VVSAWAPSPGLFAAGHVVQGLATALMLIAAAAATLPAGLGSDQVRALRCRNGIGA